MMMALVKATPSMRALNSERFKTACSPGEANHQSACACLVVPSSMHLYSLRAVGARPASPGLFAYLDSRKPLDEAPLRLVLTYSFVSSRCEANDTISALAMGV